jgi:hypothetical protein
MHYALIIYCMFRPFGQHQVFAFTVGYTANPVTFADIHSGYILCCQFYNLGWNANIHIIVKMINLKILNS